MKRIRNVAALLLLGLTVGCGGGGGSSEPGNASPKVSVDNFSINENDELSITAIASDDDGSIVSYSWTQVSGEASILTSTESATVQMTAPSVTEDSNVVLRVTVTDNQGATATATSTVAVAANMIVLKIQGAVVGGEVADAAVVATIGSQSFSTVADDDGQYSLDISVDDSFVDRVINLTAIGAEQDSVLKYKSVLGSVSDVIEVENGNHVVTSQENFGVNLSSVSTTITALMEDENGNNELTDSETYKKALIGYNGSQLFELATAIGVITQPTDDLTHITLPEGIVDTYELVSDLDAVSKFWEVIVNGGVSYGSEAQKLIFNDELLAQPLGDNAAALIDETYYSQKGGTLVLKADGSGIISAVDGKQSISWTQGDSYIDLGLPEDGFLAGSRWVYSSTVGMSIRQETRYLSLSIKWLSRTDYRDVYIMSGEFVYHYPGGELVDSPRILNNAIEVVSKTPSIINASSIINTGITIGLPLPRFIEEVTDPTSEATFFLNISDVSAVDVSFEGDPSSGGVATFSHRKYSGAGSYELVSRELDWQVNQKGHLELIEQGESPKSYSYVFTGYRDELLRTNFTTVSIEMTSHESNFVLDGEHVSWTPELAVGIYIDWGFYYPNEYFWFEIYEDGTAARIEGEDKDRDGVLLAGTYELFVRPARWIINEKGNLEIRMYRDNSLITSLWSYCMPLEYDPAGDAECVLYNEREWDLRGMTQNNKYTFRGHQLYFEDAFRDQMNNPNVSGHLFGKVYAYNAYMQKDNTRPIEIVVDDGKVKMEGSIQGFHEERLMPPSIQDFKKRELEFHRRAPFGHTAHKKVGASPR